MARIKLHDPKDFNDPIIQAICEWVTGMEGMVPNHFKLELNFPEFFTAKLGATKVLWEMGELSLEEIQHIGIAVSQANECPYCTGAFCTILTNGLNVAEQYAEEFLKQGAAAVKDERTQTLVNFALKMNNNAFDISDDDVEQLRKIGLTDKGILQTVHLVSDFTSYNRLNIALDTDYDYQSMWKEFAFGIKAS